MLTTVPNALEFYQKGELPTAWLNALRTQGLLKLFVPKEMGGLQLSLSEAMISLIETAKINASLGWMQNLVAGANYFCYCFDPATAFTLFSPVAAATCGSGQHAGKVIKKENYFVINGEWTKCSGASIASYFTVNALDEDGTVKSYLIPKENVEIIPDWNSFGLQATASYAIKVKNIELPMAYQFEIGKLKFGMDYYVARLPFVFFARCCLSATFEGIVKGALNAMLLECTAQQIKLAQPIISQLESQLNDLHEYRLNMDEKVRNSSEWLDNAAFNFNPFYTSLGQRHLSIFNSLMQLYTFGGLRSTTDTSVFHWWIRDAMTAIQHYFLKPV